jgi:HlyD family secretion protein
VPKRAVTEQGGQPVVWVVTANTANRRVIALGPERLDQIEVKTGVVPGETIVMNPPPSLTDRGLVRVRGK